MNYRPVSEREGYASDPNHPLVKALRELRQLHNLEGCVLISFHDDRVGVDSSGLGAWGWAMRQLADKILTAIDDGHFDPETASNTNMREQ